MNINIAELSELYSAFAGLGGLFWCWGGFPLCNGAEQGEERRDFTITGLMDSRLSQPERAAFNFAVCTGGFGVAWAVFVV